MTAAHPAAPRLTRDGASLVEKALAPPALDHLRRLLADVDVGGPGARLRGIPGLDRVLAAKGQIGALAATQLGQAAHPVRVILFDKNLAANRALGWHQGRTIAVRQRRDVEGYGPWSTKGGAPHVEPPIHVLEGIWQYATLVPHASHVAVVPARRRVLQVDHAASTLPGGLEWHGL